MKKYFRDLSLVLLAATFFVLIEHTLIFKTYSSLEDTCRIILKK